MLDTPASLLARLKQPNDQEAWRRFVNMYTPLLYKWARGMGLQSSDAADLVQEVFAVLVRQMPEFRYDPCQSFRSWLRTVTQNKWRDICRRRVPMPSTDPSQFECLADADPSHAFGEIEYRRYLVGRVLIFLKREFQEQTWTIFWRLMIDGQPAAQIAAEYNLTVNAVYLIKSRVLRRVREELAGLLD